VVFNKLEAIAEQDVPRTPVLACAITEALMQRYINKGGFMPSRINWAIQSSGVDYLHLLIVSMEYLIKTYAIDARLSITVHDEIRYIVKEEDAYRAAMALQISNLWTRAMFSEQVGINDVPQVGSPSSYSELCLGSSFLFRCGRGPCSSKGGQYGLCHPFTQHGYSTRRVSRHLPIAISL